MSEFASVDDLIIGYNGSENRTNTKEDKLSTKKIKKGTKSKNDTAVIENSGDLIIGKSDVKKDVNIFIPENSRFQNTLILGTKGTGKTECVLPKLVEQDLKNKKMGLTVVTTKKDMAYTIYSLAKYYKRKDIILLKPSISNVISNKLLWESSYNYDFINEKIINYKEAIKKKKVVIIDMEILKYKSEGLRAVGMLLLQLQLDIQETDITQKAPHMLYIDDAHYYLPFIEHLAYYSDNYNLGITLFLQSRNLLKKNNKDYSDIIDNNFRNLFLLNALTPTDIEYYSKKFSDNKSFNDICNRKFNSIFYEIVDSSNAKRNGIVSYTPIEKEFWEEILKLSKNNRSKLLTRKRKDREEEIREQLLNSRKTKEDDVMYEDNLDIQNNVTEQNMGATDIINPIDNNTNIMEKNEPIIENTIKSKVSKIISKSEEIKDEHIKEIIKTEEKTAKRTLSQNMFNRMNKDIVYCSDDFVFTFE